MRSILWISSRSLSFARRYTTVGRQKKAPAYYHCVGKEPLAYINLGKHLENAAEKYTNTEAVVSCHEEKRYTFSALKDEVNRLAAAFVRLGLQKGDPVGIWAPNTIQWYLTMFAASKAGLASVCINPAFQAPELEYCLQKVKVKAILAPDVFKTQQYYSILESICPELKDAHPGDIKSTHLPHLKTVIIDSKDTYPGALQFDDVLDMGDNAEALQHIEALQNSIQPDSLCNIQFTSGSTGQPKATMLSHLSIVNNGMHATWRNHLTGERICVMVPLFHAYGVAFTISAAMSAGATLVLPAPTFNPTESLHAIRNEKCTIVHGTPTMYVDLIQKQKELKIPSNTVKLAVTGGSSCSPQLIKDMKEVLGFAEIRSAFGMTEATSMTFMSMPGDPLDLIFKTVGRVADHTEAKVIDANGNTVGFGEPGELCIRGYSVMLGYFGDEEKTKETLGPDRWLKTGDQFLLYEDGYGQIVGRLKEIIIRGGENIFPKEIEDFLNTHPDIVENYVIGIEDERMGEEVCAFIRLNEGVDDLSHEALKSFCKGKIAHFKIPRYIRIVKEFPKTTSGKIQKFKLKEMFEF